MTTICVLKETCSHTRRTLQMYQTFSKSFVCFQFRGGSRPLGKSTSVQEHCGEGNFSIHDQIKGNDKSNPPREQQVKEKEQEACEHLSNEVSGGEDSVPKMQPQQPGSGNVKLVRFVSDNTLILNNGKQYRGNSNKLLEVSMEILPTEIIDLIIKMVVYSSGFSWPNQICFVCNQIFNVNRRFRECV